MRVNDVTQRIDQLQHTRGQTAIFFDTETSGLPARDSAPLSQQPCTVQLAWVLAKIPQMGDPFEELGSGSTMVMMPDGCVMSQGAERVHGISQAIANTYGVRWGEAWAMFGAMAGRANIRVAHNIPFDDRQIGFDVSRDENALGVDPMRSVQIRKLLKSRPVCTMELSQGICKLPPTERMLASGQTGFKKPKLVEAHECILGETFDGGHDAMVDVRACMRVFMALLDRAEQNP